MTAPYYNTGGTKKERANQLKMTPADSAEAELMVEAYGTRGAAMRKTAATMGEGLAKADSTMKTSVIDKLKHYFTHKK